MIFIPDFHFIVIEYNRDKICNKTKIKIMKVVYSILENKRTLSNDLYPFLNGLYYLGGYHFDSHYIHLPPH